MKNPKVYISGPMTGIPDLNYPAFHSEAQRLRGLGFDVVSPAELDHENNKEWEDFMKTDLIAMLDCQFIYLMDGWTKSRGARMEFDVATRLGITPLDKDSQLH